MTRRARLGRHLRRNVVGYVALLIAVSLTPLPAWAAATIGTSDIKNGAVTKKKLASNAVVGSKIKNGGVAKADLAAGARGFTKIVTEHLTTAIAADARTTMNVTCPAGTVAIGGGGYVTPTGIVIIGGSAGILERSLPSNPGGAPLFFNFPAGDNQAPRSWRTTVHNNQAEASTAHHYAMCASK